MKNQGEFYKKFTELVAEHEVQCLLYFVSETQELNEVLKADKEDSDLLRVIHVGVLKNIVEPLRGIQAEIQAGEMPPEEIIFFGDTKEVIPEKQPKKRNRKQPPDKRPGFFRVVPGEA